MSEVWAYHNLLLDGLLLTLLVLALSVVVALIAAFVVGIAALSDHRIVRGAALVWVEFWRGSSVIVQLFFIYFALPILIGVKIDAIVAAVIALGLNEGSYAAEIVRGTIKGRPKGQSEAAIALGMGKGLRMRRILIPQSIRPMLPSFGNVLIDTLKNSAIVFVVSVHDLMYVSTKTVWYGTGETLIVFGGLLVVYFIMSLILAGGMRLVEDYFRVDKDAGMSQRFKSRFLTSGNGYGVGGGLS